MGEYPGVDDSWMDIISSQGQSLLSVDLSGSDVSNAGLMFLKDCLNLQNLALDFCDGISDRGLAHMSGTSDLCLLSFPNILSRVFFCIMQSLTYQRHYIS